MFKFALVLSVCTMVGVTFAPTVSAGGQADTAVEVGTQLTPETIENGLFPKSANASDCEQAAKAGFTCGQIVPRKTFSLPAGVSFALGSSQLTESAKKLLAQFGPVLSRNEASGSKVIFVGHTDITGSPRLNLQLSKQRAEAVRAYFIKSYGVSPSFLVAEGVGSSQLKNTSDPASPENRRVDITAKSAQ